MVKTRTLNRVWNRISEQGDFPMLSQSLRTTLIAMSQAEVDFAALVQVVLSDFAVTQKVLRLANSAMYITFGGNITTVSRALTVLGVDTVVHIVIGMKILDHFQHSVPRRIDAELELHRTILAGCIARELNKDGDLLAAEEAVVCTLMRQIGKLLMVFYLDSEWDEICRHVEAGVDEAEACRAVIGVTAEELGLEVALRWRLPEIIRSSMNVFDPRMAQESHRLRRLCATTNYSTDVSRVLTQRNVLDEQREAAIAELAQRYGGALGDDPDALVVMSCTLAREGAGASVMREIDELHATAEASTRQALDPRARIDVGLSDLRALSATSALRTVLALACEVVHEGLGFARTVAFVRDGNGTFTARVGFGSKIDAVLPALSFEAAFEPDIFHLAIANPVGIFIENARAPRIAARLPDWYRRIFDDIRSLVLLPVMTKNRSTVALLYGDWSESQKPRRVSQGEMAALNDLARELRRFFVDSPGSQVLAS
jgi:HD-like signal output (HDOD) protein